MILPSQRLVRRLRQKRRPILVLLSVLLLIDALVLLHNRPRTTRVVLPPPSPAAAGAPTSHSHASLPDPGSIFIVSVHRNTGKILPAWSAAVLALVDHLLVSTNRNHNGDDRTPPIYFSALESGSQDDTKEKLTGLQWHLEQRGVPNTVSLGMTVWEQLDEMWARPDPAGPRQPGWIWNPEDNVYDLRRITYLARERNRAMEPMWALEREKGIKFDKVLWLNDVIFDTEDFLTLLSTNDGSFSAACSMDYKSYPHYYDTFALRDDKGQKTASTYWPWFLSETSRAAAQRGEPVRVESCWNGMVLFDAAPFYHQPAGEPLRFRAVPDSLADLHLEASECCLIHADNNNMAEKGVWLNPNVRVAYSVATYRAVQGRHGGVFPGVWGTVAGAWANRWWCWRGRIQQRLETTTVVKRVRKWQEDTPRGEELRREPGLACLINEKQIMWMNGWKHL